MDGFSLSVEAGAEKYCYPEIDGAESYAHVQVAYPSYAEEILSPYAQDPTNLTSTIYGWVPSDTVIRILDKHGGVISGDLPPLK
mgnify:CR=1 FL=1